MGSMASGIMFRRRANGRREGDEEEDAAAKAKGDGER